MEEADWPVNDIGLLGIIYIDNSEKCKKYKYSTKLLLCRIGTNVRNSKNIKKIEDL